MRLINLYRYVTDKGVIITPIKRNVNDNPHSYRLIADVNKSLTNNGLEFYSCIDVDSSDGWYEIDYQEEL